MNNKGITLIALVITVVIVVILSGTAIYVGMDTIESSKEQKLLTQLQEVTEAVNLHSEDYEDLGLEPLEVIELFGDYQYDYLLKTAEDYEKIGLSNITEELYVNFEEGVVYSDNGINGKHTLEDFGIEYYKTEKEVVTNNNAVSFQIQQLENWSLIVKDNSIICNGNISDGNLLYSEYINGRQHNWKRVLNRTTVEEQRSRI